MLFSYLYFMADEADRVAAVAAEHASYWRGLRLRHYLGGPFADRSGGLVTFDIRSRVEAEQLVAQDPFVREGLSERHLWKEWQAGEEFACA